MDTGVYSVAMPDKSTQMPTTLQEAALRVLVRQVDPPATRAPRHTRHGFPQAIRAVSTALCKVLGALKWRALLHRCTCPKSPKYVVLESTEELLPRFEEYWQGYMLAYEPRYWYVSNQGNACIEVNLD